MVEMIAGTFHSARYKDKNGISNIHNFIFLCYVDVHRPGAENACRIMRSLSAIDILYSSNSF